MNVRIAGDQAKTAAAEFPATGLVRLKSIIGPGGPIPISTSSWWAGVRSGRYPPAIKLGPRTSAWKARDIINLIEKIERGDLS